MKLVFFRPILALHFQVHGSWLIVLAVVLLLVLAVAVVLWIKIKQAEQEKLQLMASIQNLVTRLPSLESVEEAEEEGTQTEDAQNEDRSRFLRMDREVDEKRLYTRQDVSRDTLAALMGVGRNDFARIIREQGGCRNMSEYLNRKRMANVLIMMRTRPNYTLEAIAADSGIGSISTFNRVFKDFYGVSPSDYRNRLINVGGGKRGYKIGDAFDYMGSLVPIIVAGSQLLYIILSQYS